MVWCGGGGGGVWVEINQAPTVVGGFGGGGGGGHVQATGHSSCFLRREAEGDRRDPRRSWQASLVSIPEQLLTTYAVFLTGVFLTLRLRTQREHT